MKQRTRCRYFLAPIALAIAMSACSSVPRPTADMAAAKTSIEVARQAGAPAESGSAFAQARDLLQSAQSAVEQEEFAKAKRMANLAKAKAEQAQAEAELRKTEAASAEIESSLTVLREALRN